MYSRRFFLQLIGALTLTPLSAAFVSMVRRLPDARLGPRTVTIPMPARGDIVVRDGVVVSRDAGRTRVFAARCTHLGCTIAQSENGLLVCPCHGSRFRTDGSVAAGPATTPLTELPFHLDQRTGSLTVRLTD